MVSVVCAPALSAKEINSKKHKPKPVLNIWQIKSKNLLFPQLNSNYTGSISSNVSRQTTFCFQDIAHYFHCCKLRAQTQCSNTQRYATCT